MKHVNTKYIGNIEDLIEDYPVEGYTKKDGTKVKAHVRGEGGTKKEWNERSIHEREQFKERAIKSYTQWIENTKEKYNKLSSEMSNKVTDVLIEENVMKFRDVSEAGKEKLNKIHKEYQPKIDKLEKDLKFFEKELKKWKNKVTYHPSEVTFTSLGLKRSYPKKDFIKKATLKFMGKWSIDNDDKGKWITIKGTHIFIKEGETPKQAILRSIPNLKKTPLVPKDEKKKEETKKTTVSPEEKRRRETESQAKRTPKSKELSKREKAVQKLIEETGYERSRAEEVINERMGKEEIKESKQKKEKSTKIVELKKKEVSTKIQKLQELNRKKHGSKLMNVLLNMITNYLISGSQNTSQFANAIIQFKRSKKIDKKQKDALSREIINLRKEIESIHTKKDFREDLTHDFITDLKDTTLDFCEQKEDFTILTGRITRAGGFEYEKDGHSVVYYKDFDNLKEVFNKTKYIPLKATTKKGAHHAKILGYATNFKANESDMSIYADVVLFNDIENITNILNVPYSVSIGFKDRIENNNVQILEYVDHLALSLSNIDRDRCSTWGGKACNVSIKKDVS